MPRFLTLTAFAMLAAVLPPVAEAQEHAVTEAQLERTVLNEATREDTDRDALHRFIDRADVQGIASQAGVDPAELHRAVATLEGRQLTDLAERARSAEEELAGGDSIVISSTVVIIALLVLILILVAD